MSEINIDDLTSGLLNGDGVFDKLMEASQIRLEDAFTRNRITATDYSNILNQSMGAAMQQSIAFLLGKQEADAQAELTKANTLLVTQQTALATTQQLIAEQELLNLQVQKELLDKQSLEADQQLLHLTAQTVIVEEGLNTALADTAVKEQQVINLVNADRKMDADVANTAQQLLNLQADLARVEADTLLIEQNRANAVTTNSTMIKQQRKLDAETDLLGQKRLTELAQTENNADPDSVIGKQATLYQRQSEGFLRDAEQKATKMLLDTWSVRQTTDGALASTAGISDASIKDAVDALKQGIGTSDSALGLSNGGARAVGSTTGTATVLTEDSTGVLHYLVSELNAVTSGTIINGDFFQAISGTGKQVVYLTGLTPTTTYYVHFVQINSAGIVSEVESSSAFTTPA